MLVPNAVSQCQVNLMGNSKGTKLMQKLTPRQGNKVLA
jgi:hypothetical protein